VSVVLQQVMKDKWINSGFEGEDLKPHMEPVEDFSDASRIGEQKNTKKLSHGSLHLGSRSVIVGVRVFDGWLG